ncbi:MAG: hypothetical protein ABSG81_11660 [Acidimicrobiales bacterium]
MVVLLIIAILLAIAIPTFHRHPHLPGCVRLGQRPCGTVEPDQRPDRGEGAVPEHPVLRHRLSAFGHAGRVCS